MDVSTPLLSPSSSAALAGSSSILNQRSPTPQSHNGSYRKSNLQRAYFCLIATALLSLTLYFSIGAMRSPAIIPEFGFRVPANSVRRLSITSVGVGDVVVKVLQGTGDIATFEAQIETKDAFQMDPTKVLFAAQNSDGFVEIDVRFPATSWLPFFRSRNHITLFVNTPSNISDFSVTGNSVSIVYMGPNIARSVTVRVIEGSITFLSQISTGSIDIETVKGSITFALFSSASDSVRLRTSVGDMSGNLAQFKSLHASSNVGNFDMSLTAGVEYATLILDFGDGHVSSEIDSFRGKLSVFYVADKTQVRYGGAVEWPPISLYPFVTWVNGVRMGQGVCNITMRGTGSIFARFGGLPTVS
ncbi:hypothetical protein BJ741DRAFT_614131 [Chytriomyces cf. hyalinus JEL632]|nr:hypothetical protein BJ741DRAFT_614131 [Chytriomyces cf. hyalinus JEL632]